MKETPIGPMDLSEMMKIARTVAYTAGVYLVQRLGSARISRQKSAFDDLLDVDLEVERLILTRLREATPHLGILSEEAGHEGSHTNYWIVDPLDGSANFQHGSPMFAVSIALVINQSTLGGIIYLPVQNEMFSAIHNQGAYLNGTAINVSSIATLQEAITHIGDIVKDSDGQAVQERLKEVALLAPRVRRIRMIGTAATDLAYVACGRADMLINHVAHPWDIEAGKLLLTEAKGTITVKQRDHDTPLTIYSNGYLQQEAEALLVV